MALLGSIWSLCCYFGSTWLLPSHLMNSVKAMHLDKYRVKYWVMWYIFCILLMFCWQNISPCVLLCWLYPSLVLSVYDNEVSVFPFLQTLCPWVHRKPWRPSEPTCRSSMRTGNPGWVHMAPCAPSSYSTSVTHHPHIPVCTCTYCVVDHCLADL